MLSTTLHFPKLRKGAALGSPGILRLPGPAWRFGGRVQPQSLVMECAARCPANLLQGSSYQERLEQVPHTWQEACGTLSA